MMYAVTLLFPHYALFLDLFEDGELAQFLRDRGWQTATPIPAQVPEYGVRFEVPFTLVPRTPYGSPNQAHQ